MNSATVAHRWCNKDFGRNNTLTASRSCHSEGRNYFSYSTVFGQWVDLENNVCIIYTGSTSPTSSKYKLWKGDFPKDVHVFPYDDGGHSYYHGCNLISSWSNFADEDFTTPRKIVLLDYFVKQMYNHFENIVTSKGKGAEQVNFEMWGYFEEMCSIYNDCDVKKYLKYLKKVKCKKDTSKLDKQFAKHYNELVDKKKIMVGLLAEGCRDVQKITDAMFGEGSYQKYMDEVSAKFDKAGRTRERMEALCERLGIGSPYVQYRSYGRMSHYMSAADIRKLTAKQRNEIHFRALQYKEYREHDDERSKKYDRNMMNAYKWIVGYEPRMEKSWRSTHMRTDIYKCRNMFTGEEYEIGEAHIFGFYWCNTSWSFHYDDFRKSEDKTEWIRNFYAKVKEAQDTRAAIVFLKKYGVLKEKKSKYDDDIYLGVTQVGEREATDEDKRVVNEFIARQDDYFAERERVRRARELQRQREEEERRREEEYQRQVKQEQIEECLGRGEEGCRDLWRLHLTSIYDAERSSKDEDKFYFGGNILLRFNLDKTAIETSKGIRIPLAICKKFYPIFKGWHENPSSFKSIEIDTKCSGRYTISEYEDDILTAGCHDIAWTEMERMWNEIEKLENVA